MKSELYNEFMKRPLVLGAVIVLVGVLGGLFFAASNLHLLDNLFKGQPAEPSTSLAPLTGSSTTQAAGPAVQVYPHAPAPTAAEDAAKNGYSIGLKQGVSIAAGASIITKAGGTIIAPIPEISVIKAHLTADQAVSIAKNSSVIWVEINRTAAPLGETEQISLSDLFIPLVPIAHAAGQTRLVRLFELDDGANAQLSYGTTTSLVTGVSVFSPPEADGSVGHGAKIGLAAKQIIAQTGAQVELDSINITYGDGTTAIDLSLIAQGLIQATNDGADIITLSWGCIPPDPAYKDPGTCVSASQALLAGFQYAHDHGVIVVSAAGDAPGVSDPNQEGNPNLFNIGGLNGQGCVDTRLSADTAAHKGDFYASSASPDGSAYIGTSFSAPRIAAYAASLMSLATVTYDTNGNGKLDLGEMQNALKAQEQGYRYAYIDGPLLFANGGCIPRITTPTPITTPPTVPPVSSNPYPPAGAPGQGVTSYPPNYVPPTATYAPPSYISNPYLLGGIPAASYTNYQTGSPPSASYTQAQGSAPSATYTAPSGSAPSAPYTYTGTQGLGTGPTYQGPTYTPSAAQSLSGGAVANSIPTGNGNAGLAGPLVPGCEGQSCRACDLITLSQNIINFGVVFSVIVATLMFAYAGIMYVTAAGQGPEQIKKAHKVFINVLVGLLLVLLAWLLVNITLSVLSGNGLNVWTAKITCNYNPVTAAFPTAMPVIQGGTGVVAGGGGPGGTSKLNDAVATSYLDSNALPKSAHLCARYVENALRAGGVNVAGANANQLAPELKQAGFVAVSSSSNTNGYTPQAGDVVIIDPNAKSNIGHTAMYDGRQWVSDFKQQNMNPYSVPVTYTIYRG